MFEVFDPTNGIPIVTVPRVVAMAICHGARRKGRFLDYAKKGQGY